MKQFNLIKIKSIFIAVIAIVGCTNNQKIKNNMSSQKQIVEKYMDGFRSTDHAKILSCLNDDVIWEMPGFFHHEGKEAFDKEIENPAFEGKPDITIIRMIEEGNIVVAEGTVKSKFKNGQLLDASFCDVFHFDNNKIRRLTGYLMQNKQ